MSFHNNSLNRIMGDAAAMFAETWTTRHPSPHVSMNVATTMIDMFPTTDDSKCAPGELPRLLVFADDWGRHPSSCQHLVAQLLPRYRVDWVNTIGMRPPSFSWSTLQRGIGKLRDWSKRPPEQTPSAPNLSVQTPLMWPWFRRGWDRDINRRLLTQSLSRRIASGSDDVIGVTTIPIVADLMESLPVDRWIYYCVDDFGEWPGLDQTAMASMERDVVARADRLVAVSDTLRDRLSTMRPEVDVELLTHGVDLEHWQRELPPDATLPLGSDAETPLIVFWGLVDRRMDVMFLEALSQSLSRGTIAVVGPEDNPDPALERIPRVQRFDSIPYEMLPALASQADVLIMPYADLPVTRAMQPLKLLEYLATMKPVVVRELPATRPWIDCLDVASSPEEFVHAVQSRLNDGLPAEQRAGRARLEHETWYAKAVQFERFLAE